MYIPCHIKTLLLMKLVTVGVPRKMSFRKVPYLDQIWLNELQSNPRHCSLLHLLKLICHDVYQEIKQNFT